jgi:hypothetical protein
MVVPIGTNMVKRKKYQNSGREARPEKVKYLRRQVRIA